MTGRIEDFRILKALHSGSVSFENGKKKNIEGVGKIGKSLNHSIESVYFFNGLKYSLLKVSHICDKGYKVKFLSNGCFVINLSSTEVI